MDPHSQEKGQIHRPEFVILEKEQSEGERPLENQYFQALTLIQKVKPSLGLQVVIFFSIFFIFFATLIASFFFLLNVLISALALFRNKNVNKYLFQSWKNVKKLFAFLGGTLIGLFSPALGLGLIILFMMKEKEPLNQAILGRLFKATSSN